MRSFRGYGAHRPVTGLTVRHALPVVIAAGLAGVASLFFAATHLKFNASRMDLVSAGHRYRQPLDAYDAEFEKATRPGRRTDPPLDLGLLIALLRQLNEPGAPRRAESRPQRSPPP